jgi:hypothetical protein
MYTNTRIDVNGKIFSYTYLYSHTYISIPVVGDEAAGVRTDN